MYGDMESRQVEYDHEDTEWYEGLPTCDECGEKITEGYYWEIDGERLCTDCAAKEYRKEAIL